MKSLFAVLLASASIACAADSIDVKKTDTFRRIKSHIDQVPAIDTHDHLKPFVEGIYGATEFTRRCLAEALAEKVERNELREADALRIGQQVMRENALELFPRLRDKLRKH